MSPIVPVWCGVGGCEGGSGGGGGVWCVGGGGCVWVGGW